MKGRDIIMVFKAGETVYSIEAFEAFVQKAENLDKRFELVEGDLFEVPSNAFVSNIAGIILTFLNMYLFNHKIGRVTGADGVYIVGGHVYAPDVAYISFEKQPQLEKDGFNPNPPDLAVEVISSDRADELNTLRIKISNYLAVGTTVWVVQPEIKQVEVYRPGKPVQIFDENGTLSGDDLLPGFELKVADILHDSDIIESNHKILFLRSS